MQADKLPDAGIAPEEQKPEERRKPLWSFAKRVGKARLGPNRTIHGED